MSKNNSTHSNKENMRSPIEKKKALSVIFLWLIAMISANGVDEQGNYVVMMPSLVPSLFMNIFFFMTAVFVTYRLFNKSKNNPIDFASNEEESLDFTWKALQIICVAVLLIGLIMWVISMQSFITGDSKFLFSVYSANSKLLLSVFSVAFHLFIIIACPITYFLLKKSKNYKANPYIDRKTGNIILSSWGVFFMMSIAINIFTLGSFDEMGNTIRPSIFSICFFVIVALMTYALLRDTKKKKA